MGHSYQFVVLETRVTLGLPKCTGTGGNFNIHLPDYFLIQIAYKWPVFLTCQASCGATGQQHFEEA